MHLEISRRSSRSAMVTTMSQMVKHATTSLRKLTRLLFWLHSCSYISSRFFIRARDIMNKVGVIPYMDTIFPLYSLFGFVFLHMLMYAGNIYFWRRYRVNYSLIFGFKQGTELGYREVLLVSFGLAMLALGDVLSNLEIELDPKTKEYKQLTELLPLFLLLLVIVILVSPFNIVYRSSPY